MERKKCYGMRDDLLCNSEVAAIIEGIVHVRSYNLIAMVQVIPPSVQYPH